MCVCVCAACASSCMWSHVLESFGILVLRIPRLDSLQEEVGGRAWEVRGLVQKESVLSWTADLWVAGPLHRLGPTCSGWITWLEEEQKCS